MLQILLKLFVLCFIVTQLKGQQTVKIFGGNEKFNNNNNNKQIIVAADYTDNKLADLPAKSNNVNGNAEVSKRGGRQLFLQPNWFVVQNFGFPQTFSCLTTRGQPGVCVPVGSCQLSEEQRLKRQLIYLTPVVTRQDTGSCIFYDRFGLGQFGSCCSVTSGGILPMEESSRPVEIPNGMNSSKYEPTGGNNIENAIDIDSETIVSPTNEPTSPLPPKTEVNTEEVKEEINPSWPFDIVRYPWPSQYPTQFSGVQSYPWPPPIPTHRPALGSWPPPVPTHPPNHHYPTHPPSSSVITSRPITTTSRRTTTTTTTKRPSYPSYRPTQTTTTHKPSTISNDVSETGLPLQCGIKNPVSPDQERIVGGNNASPHEFPWIAVLFKSGKQFCGGSLITKNHILSAAHCVARMTPWDVAALTAHLGDYNIRTDFEVRHVSRRIKRLVRHKGFDFSTLHNDVSILTLNEPVKFSYEIQPICLPTMNSQLTRSYSGYVATVVGWGSLRENGPQPSILQKVDIPVWTNGECARKYGGAAPAGIISSMLCAGVSARDSCSGDSGGPLIVKENGRYTQVGIVSWGIGCGKGEYPGVYTRVTSLLPWIYKNIK